MYDYDPHAVHAPGDQHIKHVPLTSLSKLSPYSALTLSIVLVILFLLKQYVIEAFLLKRLYGSRYTQLNEVNRRGFVNHHIAGATKLIILVAAVYPFINVAFRYAVLNDPYARGSRVTLGDVLVVCTQVLVGMYVFELIYRVKIRYVAFSLISTVTGTNLAFREKVGKRCTRSLDLDRYGRRRGNTYADTENL